MQQILHTLAFLFFTTFSLQAQELQFVKEIVPGTAGIEIIEVAKTADYFFFVAETTANDYPSLWRTDGTEDGTILLQEHINWIELTHNYISDAFNGIIFYQATNVNTGKRDLWRTDGTLEGTYLLLDLEGDQLRPGGFVQMNGAVYFSGRILTEDDERRRALFKTDGTQEGTERITILPTCTSHSNNNVEKAILFNDIMYWFYHSGTCIFRSDGTEAGTGFYYNPDGLFDLQQLIMANDRFYFTAIDYSFENWLYRADGVPLGVDAIADGINPNGHYAPLGDKIIFTNWTPDHAFANDLWVSNDADQSTNLLFSFGTTDTFGRIENLVPFNNQIYFLVNYFNQDSNGSLNELGTEIWATDGTIEGTQLIQSIYAGSSGSHISNLLVWNEKMFFITKPNEKQYSLFQTDGTSEGTSSIMNLALQNAIGAPPNDLYFHNNNLYLTTGDIYTGRELWRIHFPIVNTNEMSKEASVMTKVIPNPFQQNAIIQLQEPLPTDAQVYFFNQMGQAINFGFQIENDHIQLDSGRLPEGLYYFQIYSKGVEVAKGKFITQ